MRVLLLDLDTLRPDHLGCYGYHRRTSPNIDAIAEDGVRFDEYYCSDAPCLPSRCALMTGRFGIHTGIVGHGGTAADLRLQGEERHFRDWTAGDNLPWRFRERGMHTCSISTFAERHAAWWFNSGFNEVHNVGKGGMESAEDVTPVALKWVEDHGGDEDWFLHVNYWDPHTIYRAPEDFGNPFADDPLPEWLTETKLEAHKQMVGPHKPLEVNMYDGEPDPRFPRHVSAIRDMDDLRRHVDGYDCGIAYMDAHIGRLVEALKAKGVWDDLVVIVTSDHGENQGELGIYAEHGTADRPTCRIPMILRWPGGAKGHVDRGLHYNLDLNPTLAELLGQEPKPRWDGRSYAATIVDGAERGRDQLVVSQCAHVCQRGVRWGDWLYVRTWHDGYHLFPEEMLFDLAKDPYEEHDLARVHPDVAREGARRLQTWHDEMMATMPDGYTVDPMRTVLAEGGPFHARGKLRDYCAHLEATGRADAIPELRARHPAEFA